MRKLLVLLILTSVGLFACKGVLAPDPVHKAFMEKFKNAENVEWEQDGNEWEAEFAIAGKEMCATYDTDGNWLETEWDIPVEDLPADMKASITPNYEGFSIKEVEKVETLDFEGYEVILLKGDAEIEIMINSSGLIKVVEDDDMDAHDEDDEDEGHIHDNDGDGHADGDGHDHEKDGHK